jgi:hypothetical protein
VPQADASDALLAARTALVATRDQEICSLARDLGAATADK